MLFLTLSSPASKFSLHKFLHSSQYTLAHEQISTLHIAQTLTTYSYHICRAQHCNFLTSSLRQICRHPAHTHYNLRATRQLHLLAVNMQQSTNSECNLTKIIWQNRLYTIYAEWQKEIDNYPHVSMHETNCAQSTP